MEAVSYHKGRFRSLELKAETSAAETTPMVSSWTGLGKNLCPHSGWTEPRIFFALFSFQPLSAVCRQEKLLTNTY